MRINTVLCDCACTTFIKSQHTLTARSNRPRLNHVSIIGTFYICIIERQRTRDIKRIIIRFLLRNSNSMAIAVDDNVLFKFINGYYTIIVTNLNRIAVFSCFDSCIQSIIRLRTSLCNNLRNKRFCRRSRSRLTAAARAAYFALLLISCSCIGIVAAAFTLLFSAC